MQEGSGGEVGGEELITAKDFIVSCDSFMKIRLMQRIIYSGF
jgi:hypothetical protein